MKTRRAVITGVGVGGLAITLAACGGSDGASGETVSAAQPSAPSQTPELSATSSPPDAAAGTAGEEVAGLATTAEIPVGGGTIFGAQKVVVTQPSAGEFKCFSAVCPHQGCTVSDVEGGTINCPCHGSKFAVADGSVLRGPATNPLPEQAIKVEGGTITLA